MTCRFLLPGIEYRRELAWHAGPNVDEMHAVAVVGQSLGDSSKALVERLDSCGSARTTLAAYPWFKYACNT